MENFSVFELSELDQIMPRLYMRWLLCFPITEASPSKAAIVDLLENGVKAAVEKLPILQGIVVPKPLDSSRLEVHIPKDSHVYELRIQHHDCDNDNTFPTYDSLREADFAPSSLPDRLLTPPDIDPNPVFDMMATFIRGGLLLCIKFHHAVVDGVGLALVIKYLAQNCYKLSVRDSSTPIIPPSIDRAILPPRRTPCTRKTTGFNVVDLDEAGCKSAKEYGAMTSHTFRFSSESLRILKGICQNPVSMISTQDALTALLYGSVSHARGLRFTMESDEVTTIPSIMGIAVNGRGRLEPPAVDYTGNFTMYAAFACPISLPTENITRQSFKDLDKLSKHLNLPALASQSRAAITAVTHDSIVSVISTAASLQDISRLQPAFSNYFQGTDFFITCATDFPVFEQDWWTGGRVETWRVPFKKEWDGTCAVLPTKDRSKGLDILLGLREDDMAIVKELLISFGAIVL
ncbi:uncharacterized protein RSE6_11867 [Rhynchosporium secalis]|uniref:Trichothecene 3-O-acetyltransferase-like N-terminal domain-containing protein n=1 Tax=Rhynchosporium secalis TaxID=38038 RepID=A0A1E1MP34_RHYSE|nr:uncharacterized protein RSE6_11867 [Rhynchosporium secalis]